MPTNERDSIGRVVLFTNHTRRPRAALVAAFDQETMKADLHVLNRAGEDGRAHLIEYHANVPFDDSDDPKVGTWNLRPGERDSFAAQDDAADDASAGDGDGAAPANADAAKADAKPANADDAKPGDEQTGAAKTNANANADPAKADTKPEPNKRRDEKKAPPPAA